MSWAETLERVVDEVVALIVVLALITTVFLGIEPGVIKDAFLLIIGYFFGAKAKKAIEKLVKS